MLQGLHGNTLIFLASNVIELSHVTAAKKRWFILLFVLVPSIVGYIRIPNQNIDKAVLAVKKSRQVKNIEESLKKKER